MTAWHYKDSVWSTSADGFSLLLVFFFFFFNCSCSVEVCQELISPVTPLYELSVICMSHRATFFSVRKRVPDTVLI